MAIATTIIGAVAGVFGLGMLTGVLDWMIPEISMITRLGIYMLVAGFVLVALLMVGSAIMPRALENLRDIFDPSQIILILILGGILLIWGNYYVSRIFESPVYIAVVLGIITTLITIGVLFGGDIRKFIVGQWR